MRRRVPRGTGRTSASITKEKSTPRRASGRARHGLADEADAERRQEPHSGHREGAIPRLGREKPDDHAAGCSEVEALLDPADDAAVPVERPPHMPPIAPASPASRIPVPRGLMGFLRAPRYRPREWGCLLRRARALLMGSMLAQHGPGGVDSTHAAPSRGRSDPLVGVGHRARSGNGDHRHRRLPQRPGLEGGDGDVRRRRWRNSPSGHQRDQAIDRRDDPAQPGQRRGSGSPPARTSS